VPQLKHCRYDIDSVTLDNIIDSSNMTPSLWVDIAEIIEREYDKYDGFVVLHGTDTMAYTASALSFMFKNLAKPIVLTGSEGAASGTTPSYAAGVGLIIVKVSPEGDRLDGGRNGGTGRLRRSLRSQKQDKYCRQSGSIYKIHRILKHSHTSYNFDY